MAGVNVHGGHKLGSLTLGECLSQCKEEDLCYATDYNKKNGHCYQHYMQTACDPKFPNKDIIHFSRVHCKGECVDDLRDNPLVMRCMGSSKV